jgi:AAA15 family ATPase/GTPase
MLIEFSVTNFRSIRERQTLSLVAASGKELAKTNTFSGDGAGAHALVRSAVLYGPNAAGKSNLLLAASFLRDFVLTSSIRQVDAAIQVVPFGLCAETKAQPSAFEIMFVEDGVRYHYGLELTTRRVVREWLVAYPVGKPQRWFERVFDPETESYSWTMGPHFKAERGQRELFQKTTRDNAAFLSTAIQLNNEQLRPVFNWFSNKLAVVTLAQPMNWFLSIQSMQDPALRPIINQIVQAGDVGITELDLQEEDVPTAPQGVQINVILPPGAVVGSEGSKLKQIRIVAMHKQIDSDKLTSLELHEESDGTRKLLQYAGGWIKALAEGATLLIDELDGSLHPMLTKFLIGLFHDPEHNKNGAQLVFTTHDTNLLDTNIFRRDQIWFAEKDRNSATKIYPLLDYSPRKDKDLERGYLQGRYGAIPFIGSVNF